jgi:hypothetical protein
MEEAVPVVKRNAYHHYLRTPHRLEAIFHLFLTQDDSTYMMREVQADPPWSSPGNPKIQTH